MGAFSCVRIILKYLLLLLVTTLAIIFGAVFAVPMAILVYIWRFFVLANLTKFLRPDLLKILTCRSTVFASDDIYSRPKCSLVSSATIPGELDFDLAKIQGFLEQKINTKDSFGNLARPEMQQFVVQWLGYSFWKSDENFCIANHVTEYSGPHDSNGDADSIDEIVSDLLSKPFPNGRSPWHLYVLRNFENSHHGYDDKPTLAKTKNYFILHTHHCLADGFSLLKLLSAVTATAERISNEDGRQRALTTTTTPPLMKVKNPEMAPWKKVAFWLTLPIALPLKSIQICLESLDTNELHVPEEKLSGFTRTARLDKIPVKFVKEIKNRHGVNFTSVVLAALTGGLRNFMLENRIKVPQNMHVSLPLPMPNHPEKLSNHMAAAYVRLPVGIPDPQKRLLALDKDLSEVYRSTYPHVFFLALPCVGALPSFLIRLMGEQRLVSVGSSICAGPSRKIQFLGMPISGLDFSVSMFRGNIGISYCSLSYDGFVGITVGIDQNLLPKNTSVKGLGKKIAEEFEILKKDANYK